MRTHAAHPIPLRAVKLDPVIPPFGGSRSIARRYGPAAVGFGLRIMPGVRLSASPRGLRMGLGPRAARIHVGSGRPTISTRCRAGHGVDRLRAETPSYEWRWASEGFGSWAQPAAGWAEVAEQARQLAVLEAALVSAHQTAFAGAERAVAEPPTPVDEGAIRRDAKREQMVGISMFAFKERAAARERAREVRRSGSAPNGQRGLGRRRWSRRGSMTSGGGCWQTTRRPCWKRSNARLRITRLQQYRSTVSMARCPS